MNKITITPIGTCRINTPLKRGATRYPIKLDYRRTYGFVHTSEEAVQQMLYRRGELVVPDEVKPILFRPDYHREGQEPVNASTDLTIVEISSIKSCLIGDTAVQLNYVIRHFADFLVVPARAKAYWKMVGKGDRAALNAYLQSDQLCRLVSEEDRALLGQMRFSNQTFDQVQSDMQRIVEFVGQDRLLFVTHVNALTPDGELITGRDKLIRWVKQAAERLGVPCFDPTDLMLEFGQERALEKEGLDLTHFTNAFYDHWYRHVQRVYILPHAGEGDASGDHSLVNEAAIVTETVSAAIDHDDFFDGTRQLFAALKSYPDYVPLQLLHGQVLARLGDYDGASKLFANHAEAEEMTAETRQSYMRVLLETGDHENALKIARQMLTDEYENEEIYEIAGFAAQHLGYLDEALRYKKLAFRYDPTSIAPALSVLATYSESGDTDACSNWLEEVLALTEERGNGASARAVVEWALSHKDTDLLGRALTVLAEKDMAVLPPLIDEARTSGMHGALAAAAIKIMDMPTTEKTDRALRKLAQNWADDAVQHMSDDRLPDAYGSALACLSVVPRNSSAVRVKRGVMDTLRKRIMASRADPVQVVKLAGEAGELVFEQPAVANLYAKSLTQLKRLADAEQVYRRLHEANPDDLGVTASYAHVASLNGDFSTALRLYGELSLDRSEDARRFSMRTGRFLASAAQKGVRHLRVLAADERFDDALLLAALLERYTSIGDRLAGELDRLLRSMRSYLRQLDEEGLAPGEVLHLLQLMLALAPEDGPLIRRAALEAMKLEEFELALEYWQRLDVVAPGFPSTGNNIRRCEIFIDRAARKKRGRARLAA